jgi:hypothetical protein
MQRSTLGRILASALLSGSACTSPDLVETCPVEVGASPAETVAALQSCFGSVTDNPVNTRSKRDVDILFVIDNSPSMTPKQKQIASTIDSFIKRIDAIGSNYHVGVVSTDIGAQAAPGISFQPGNLDVSGCGSYFGDDGELQGKACSERDQSQWSADAKSACSSLCPIHLAPQKGDRYLWKTDGVSNAPGNDLIGTFKCMAMLGDSGCGLESPLEAAKRALDHHNSLNDGFLRKNSVLSIIFITDEDDCSVQLSARSLNNPAFSDCTNANQSPLPASCYRNDFRCLAYNLACNEPLSTPGLKTGCHENGNGYLESIDKYVRFFSQRDPGSLVLAGIWTPSLLDNPKGDPARDGKLEVEYDPLICKAGGSVSCGTDALNRGRGSKAACQSPSDPQFFGQAQLRLSKFVRSFPASARVEQSVCEPQNFGSVLDVVADRIGRGVGSYCLSAKPRPDSSGAPICVVGLVDESTPSAVPDSKLPQCSAKCCGAWSAAGGPSAPTAQPVPSDPSIVQACGADPSCFCAVASPFCGDTALAGVWMSQSPHQTPAGKVVTFKCAGSVR